MESLNSLKGWGLLGDSGERGQYAVSCIVVIRDGKEEDDYDDDDDDDDAGKY